MPAVQQKQRNLGADYITNFSPTFKNTITRHVPPSMGQLHQGVEILLVPSCFRNWR